MEKILSKQDVLDLFAESDRRFAESNRRLEESLAKSRAESDRRFEDRLAKEAKEREKSKKAFEDRLAKEAIEREKRRKELDDRYAILEEKSKKEFDKRIGEITGLWGKFVEGLVEPGSIELFQNRGIEVITTAQNIKKKQNGREIYQIDLLLLNKIQAVVIEVKSTLKVADVDEHLERMDKIRRSPIESLGLHKAALLGAVAGIRIEENADKYAYKKGLYVLRQKGNLVEIANDEDFRPKEWKAG